MDKLKVVVLMGGKSPEYEISLLTGREVLRYLDRRKHEVAPFVINRQGKNLNLQKIQKFFGKSPGRGVVFLAMHGPFGEDGTIQAMFEFAGLRYTGSGVSASILGMDKIKFRKVMAKEKISVPGYLVFHKNDSEAKIWEFFGRPPVFVKPYNQGSSVGASLVRKKAALQRALKLTFTYSNPILVEEYLRS